MVLAPDSGDNLAAKWAFSRRDILGFENWCIDEKQRRAIYSRKTTLEFVRFYNWNMKKNIFS